MKILLKVLCCLALLVSSVAFAADASDIKAGERFEIDSKVLGEKRQILVHLPGSYTRGQTRFPVLYLTDGAAHFLHTVGTIDFLGGVGRAPEMIVVGVNNTDRTRDLTPTKGKEEGMESAGGADKFIKFFEEELIPTINQRYRSAPYKVFAGHSLGGLFAIHTYLNRPNVFDAYIAVSPSLWWDDKLILKRAEVVFAKQKAQGVLFMSLGDEDKDMQEPFAGFRTLVEKNAGPDFHFGSQLFPDEDHGSVVLRSHYHGLRKVFEGWNLPREASFQQALEHFAKLSKRFKYTITLPEPLANGMGYFYMGEKKFDQAIEVMTWNTKTYPASANTYDSLCEVLANAGKLPAAKAQCEQAVRIGQENKDLALPEYKKSLERVTEKLNAQSKK